MTAEQKTILNRLDKEIEAISQYIYQRQAASQQQGVRLRLLETMASFQLTQLEVIPKEKIKNAGILKESR